MSIIDTTTGHSPKAEKKVARILYVCIGVAVVAVLALVLIVGGGSNSLNPYKTDNPAQEAPVESP
ncbi:hypothetical protein AZI86_05050 [Bdellovibrio bacteriovorus]|uniref:Uncharacterized protein n=1 Tax=Bdellovibrio bacteriovorus TaxID=959 RepID=A0A150WQ45_BDEBC|nr:hypothetical protein [Bdellovibrio bacteriovorus]KYG66419.1 hypothetical protein AZI86_05050 [Bdellovibrio bacteriovorus]